MLRSLLLSLLALLPPSLCLLLLSLLQLVPDVGVVVWAASAQGRQPPRGRDATTHDEYDGYVGLRSGSWTAMPRLDDCVVPAQLWDAQIESQIDLAPPDPRSMNQ